MELDPDKEIKRMHFGDEDCHIAVVHKLQGGASTGYKEALILRAQTQDLTVDEYIDMLRATKKVSVTMNFEDFLKKFFNMYNEDAYILAKALGFDTDEADKDMDLDWQEYLDKRASEIEILRSVKDGNDFLQLDEETQIKLLRFQEAFEGGLKQTEEKMPDKQVEQLLRSVSELTKELQIERKAREELEEKIKRQEKEEILERASSVGFVKEDEVEVVANAVFSLSEEEREAIFRAFDSAKEEVEQLSAKLKEKEEDMFRSTSLDVEDEALDARALASKKIRGEK